MNIILHACMLVIVLDNKIGKDDRMQLEQINEDQLHVHACMTMNEQFCYFAQDWHFHCSLLFVMNHEGTAQQAI